MIVATCNGYRYHVPAPGERARVLLPSAHDGRERWHTATVRGRVRQASVTWKSYTARSMSATLRLVSVLVDGEDRERDVAVERFASAVPS